MPLAPQAREKQVGSAQPDGTLSWESALSVTQGSTSSPVCGFQGLEVGAAGSVTSSSPELVLPFPTQGRDTKRDRGIRVRAGHRLGRREAGHDLTCIFMRFCNRAVQLTRATTVPIP